MGSSSKKLRKIIGWPVMIVSGLVFVAAILWAALYVTDLMHEDVVIEGTGQNNASFTVHYFDNEIFGGNPVSSNLHFLRHFTDFIEIESSFSANFSEDLDISYTYVAEKRFVITHLGSGGANPVVFEEITELSRARGGTFGNELNFSSDSGYDEPGGIYTIFPREYMEIFLSFSEYHEQQIENEGGTSAAFRGFSAELFIEFSYSVLAMPAGINETTVRGYRIPIAQDVFVPEVFGTHSFNAVVNLTTETPIIDIYTILIFATVIAISGLGVFIGIRCISVGDSNEHHKKAKAILKKFSSEIVVSKSPMDLSNYTVMIVDEFEEILKLSINLNKHIMCYHDTEKMELCTIVDEHAYYYYIDYQGRKNNIVSDSVRLGQAANSMSELSHIKLVSDMLLADINTVDSSLRLDTKRKSEDKNRQLA